jgi:hypothetical protein
LAQARRKPLLCLVHVTNQMAVSAGDLAKGEANGAYASLNVVGAVGDAWHGLDGWPARAAITAAAAQTEL